MKEHESGLHSESDVEQKFIYPLLTKLAPDGLGYSPHQIRTKPDIRAFNIGKGKEQKLYYPDVVVLAFGLPMVVVEAKAPGEGVVEGHREARLYAAELNATFPPRINPASIVLCTDGVDLVAGSWDSTSPTVQLRVEDADSASASFAALVDLAKSEKISSMAHDIQVELFPREAHRALDILGGRTVEDEEVGVNWLGAHLVSTYRRVFNPATREDRTRLARDGYVTSRRRERYVDPISRVIRAATPPSQRDTRTLQDSSDPSAIYGVLRRGKDLEQHVLLVIGGPGVGKSTFIDYVQEVKLPDDLREQTTWVHVNMNPAPVNRTEIYSWLRREIVEELRRVHPTVDFDAVDVLQRLYAPQLNRLRKGPLALLEPDSDAYRERLADALLGLQDDDQATVDSYIRYLCAERGKLMVVVLDNCDKRSRDDQLLMFEVAQWAKHELRCLVVLPLREETYDNYRSQPPLDTALKDLAFRVEAPAFHDVLHARLKMVGDEMRVASDGPLTFDLKSGVRVQVTREEQHRYLQSMLKSLLVRDGFFRSIILGLAGQNIRRALEIYLELCTSGYVTDEETVRIRHAEGDYTLPFHTVCLALLKRNRRHYRGDASLLMNLFQREPGDPASAHFVRPATLRWLHKRQQERGMARVSGYFRVDEIVRDIVLLGVEGEIVRREMLRLLHADCIVAEHLQTHSLDERDLVRIGPAGIIHLQFMQIIEYLGSTAEDVWITNEAMARRICNRLSAVEDLWDLNTYVRNARDLVEYLESHEKGIVGMTQTVMRAPEVSSLVSLADQRAKVDEWVERQSERDPWFTVVDKYSVGEVFEVAVWRNHPDYGVFAELERGVDGLIPKSRFSGTGFEEGLGYDQRVRVRVMSIDEDRKRISLAAELQAFT